MGFLDSLTSYNGNAWEVSDEQLLSEFDAEGFKDVESAEVTEKEQDWGISHSICLLMVGGTRKYVPLSRDSDLETGDKVDINSINILTLSREGDEDIYKADGNVLEEPKKKGRRSSK